MYTIEVLEDLNAHLDEIIWFMEDTCNDYYVELKKNESETIEGIKDNLYTARNIIMSSIKKRYKNQ